MIVIAMKLFFHLGSDIESCLMRKKVEMRIVKLILYLSNGHGRTLKIKAEYSNIHKCLNKYTNKTKCRKW